jgi:hypothetical protein
MNRAMASRFSGSGPLAARFERKGLDRGVMLWGASLGCPSASLTALSTESRSGLVLGHLGPPKSNETITGDRVSVGVRDRPNAETHDIHFCRVAGRPTDGLSRLFGLPSATELNDDLRVGGREGLRGVDGSEISVVLHAFNIGQQALAVKGKDYALNVRKSDGAIAN